MGDPISAAWTGQGRFRYDVSATGVAQVGTSIALDFAVLCFPLTSDIDAPHGDHEESGGINDLLARRIVRLSLQNACRRRQS